MGKRSAPLLALAALVLTFALLAGGAMRHTSVTFDEIMFPAAGARGIHTGDFTLVRDHPRLSHYLFGIPAWLTATGYPRIEMYTAYRYARQFYFGVGNDPERLAFNTRLVGVALGMLLVVATFLLTRRHLGEGGALLAAGLVAFLPDVLAHAGVAYNDLASTLTIFVAGYALDACIRAPSRGRFALAALATAAALCVKTSAAILAPIACVLLAMEALTGRWRDRAWRRGLEMGALVFLAVFYVAVVAVYLGDWRLFEFIASAQGKLAHFSSGHYGFPALLLGERSATGWWYYFPVAFVFKTPAALHALMVLAAIGAAMALRERRPAWLTSPLRVPVVAAALFTATLLASSLDIGFRHALPVLPFLCVMIAYGVRELWVRGPRIARALAVALVAWNAIGVACAYPYFLSYLSEYAHDRPPYEVLADSNIDWGQGLLGLRDFMRSRGIDQVSLSYFGSAAPEGYGIRYHALESHFPIPGNPASAATPRFIAISATNLAGVYLPGDPFARWRGRTPVAIVGGSIWVFEAE